MGLPLHEVSRQGQVFVISAPSGAGKTTLVDRLLRRCSLLERSISHTTRKKREGEVDSADYHFISQEEFQKRINSEEFLEYSLICGNYYGSSWKEVESVQKKGKHVILVIDTQGGLKAKKTLSAHLIFIRPPSFEELVCRLRSRGSETEEEIQMRLLRYQKEILDAESYDCQIVNDNLEEACRSLEEYIIRKVNHHECVSKTK